MKKIYVSIASYRDPFLQRTIDSLYCTAKNPENISVGCFIHAFQDELDLISPINRDGYNVNFDIEEPGTLFSVTECRNRSLKWLKDDDYILQVDAHTAFDNEWDEYLINFIENIDDKKPVLSGALSSFGIYKDGTEIRIPVIAPRTFYVDPVDTKRAYMNAFDLAPNGTIIENLPNKNYAHGWYTAGHFMFAPAEYFKSIKQPEWVLFWGEEIINSVRTYTAGWNVYIPEEVPLYHLDENVTFTGRPRLWQDFPDDFFPKREPVSDRIIDIMIGLSHEDNDIFYNRTLEEFYDHVGVNLGKLFDNWRKQRKWNQQNIN
jgi:hypothetical protein